MIWCSLLWTTGHIVTPTLFVMLDDCQLTSFIAGWLFHAEAWVGLAAGYLLLLAATTLIRYGEAGYQWLRWLVLVMLLYVLVGYLGLQSLMASLRGQADAPSVAVGGSPYRAQFGMLCGISSMFYLVQNLLGSALVWKTAGVRQVT